MASVTCRRPRASCSGAYIVGCERPGSLEFLSLPLAARRCGCHQHRRLVHRWWCSGALRPAKDARSHRRQEGLSWQDGAYQRLWLTSNPSGLLSSGGSITPALEMRFNCMLAGSLCCSSLLHSRTDLHMVNSFGQKADV